jgi:hypothetical protein
LDVGKQRLFAGSQAVADVVLLVLLEVRAVVLVFVGPVFVFVAGVFFVVVIVVVVVVVVVEILVAFEVVVVLPLVVVFAVVFPPFVGVGSEVFRGRPALLLVGRRLGGGAFSGGRLFAARRSVLPALRRAPRVVLVHLDDHALAHLEEAVLFLHLAVGHLVHR